MWNATTTTGFQRAKQRSRGGKPQLTKTPHVAAQEEGGEIWYPHHTYLIGKTPHLPTTAWGLGRGHFSENDNQSSVQSIKEM